MADILLTDTERNVITSTVTLNPPALTPAAQVGIPDGMKPVVSQVQYDPTREYVSAGGYAAYSAYAQTLPASIDDVTRDLGADLYERMLNDAQVAGDVNSLVRAILANGVSVLPGIEPEKTPLRENKNGDKTGGKDTRRYTQAVEYAEFISRLFARVKLLPVLNDMLSAVALGNRVAELVWKIETNGPDTGRMVLDRIKPKPREHTAFVIDNTGNTVGVLARLGWYGVYGAGWQGNLLDPATTPGFLPVGKFAILTYAPKNSDPRGTSVLRPAYNPWWLKQQAWADFLRHLAQIGGGVLWGTTAEGALGTDIPNGDGTYTKLTAEQAMVNQLLNVRSGSVAAFPNGSTLQALAVDGAPQTFTDAIELFDRQISKAILSQTLATNEGQHQSRAATGSQKDIFDLLVEFGESSVVGMLDPIVDFALENNFPGYDCELRPRILMSAAEEADLATLGTAIASLQTAGYFSPSQYAAIDQKLGLPIRTPEEVDAMKEAAEKAATMLAPGTDTARNGVPATNADPTKTDPTDPKPDDNQDE